MNKLLLNDKFGYSGLELVEWRILVPKLMEILTITSQSNFKLPLNVSKLLEKFDLEDIKAMNGVGGVNR